MSILDATIYDIINEVNEDNGHKYKELILLKHRDNELLKRVLKMTYDIVTYSYGVTMKNIVYTPERNYIPQEEYTLSSSSVKPLPLGSGYKHS